MGLLHDLTRVLPTWFPLASRVVTTSFFFWLLVIRQAKGASRPKVIAAARRSAASIRSLWRDVASSTEPVGPCALVRIDRFEKKAQVS